MEADVVEAGIRRQTGLGAGGAIEHGGQARLLDGLEHRHLLRDAAPGTRQELLHAVGKVHAAREVDGASRSEEHTSELQSLMRISYAVFCLKKKKYKIRRQTDK